MKTDNKNSDNDKLISEVERLRAGLERIVASKQRGEYGLDVVKAIATELLA
jgi:hypothetical protein